MRRIARRDDRVGLLVRGYGHQPCRPAGALGVYLLGTVDQILNHRRQRERVLAPRDRDDHMDLEKRLRAVEAFDQRAGLLDLAR